MFRSYPGSIQRLGKRPYPQIRPMLPGQMPPVPFESTSLCVTFNMSMKFLQYHSRKKNGTMVKGQSRCGMDRKKEK